MIMILILTETVYNPNPKEFASIPSCSASWIGIALVS